MDGKTLALLYKTVQDNNILPITTICNVRCAFCSHHQNPPEVQAIAIPHLDFDLILDLLDYLDGSRKIIIGESTSLIMEGEPFTHPAFFETLEAIRHKFPQTPIQVTTNGTWLTEENIIRLQKLESLELIFSLNACHPQVRRVLMADRRALTACAAPPLLKQYGLCYHGSIVAMPHLTGWEELEQTVQYLHENHARTIRIFQPGYTRLTKTELIPDAEVFQRLQHDTIRWQQEGIPVTLEPQSMYTLDAVVEAVIASSPAQQAGLVSGDLLLQIDGRRPFSRADAFAMLRENGVHQLQWRRQAQLLKGTITITNQFSGLVMYYDLQRSELQQLERLAADGRQYVMLCSQLGAPAWQAAGVPENVQIHIAENRYFGGNIQAAGLLTISDFQYALEQITAPYDAVILPAIAFNDSDNDLAGQSLFSWSQQIEAELILF